MILVNLEDVVSLVIFRERNPLQSGSTQRNRKRRSLLCSPEPKLPDFVKQYANTFITTH